MKSKQLRNIPEGNKNSNTKARTNLIIVLFQKLKFLKIAFLLLFALRKIKQDEINNVIEKKNNEYSRGKVLKYNQTKKIKNSSNKKETRKSDKKPTAKKKDTDSKEERTIPENRIEHKTKTKRLSTPDINKPNQKVRDNRTSTPEKPDTKHISKKRTKVNPETIFIKPEEERRSQIKFIGYDPNNYFRQNEPYNYPYVIMPKPRSIIKFPRKNKIGNKGYTEDYFFAYINKYFKNQFKIYDDRILVISSKQNPYEPDIAMIDEESGLNLFLDIEIDEPYDGITREPMHYKGYNNERDKFFRNRGWLTIRFAEEQIWKYPEGCCKFIFKVIHSINDKYYVPDELDSFDNLEFITQWSIEQAKQWANQKYRESYLGIENFSAQNIHKELMEIPDNELESKTEEQVSENDIELKLNPEELKKTIVKQAINTGKYISCKFNKDSVYTILKPELFNGVTLKSYCFVKNKERELIIANLQDLIIRDQPSLVRINGEMGVSEIRRIVNDAIQNHKLIRMKYTRSEWNEHLVDEETGELILNHIESEQSLRTISDVDYSINVLTEESFNQYNLNSEDYISAYCHKREEQRTFRVDRINELEILNI